MRRDRSCVNSLTFGYSPTPHFAASSPAGPVPQSYVQDKPPSGAVDWPTSFSDAGTTGPEVEGEYARSHLGEYSSCCVRASHRAEVPVWSTDSYVELLIILVGGLADRPQGRSQNRMKRSVELGHDWRDSDPFGVEGLLDVTLS